MKYSNFFLSCTLVTVMSGCDSNKSVIDNDAPSETDQECAKHQERYSRIITTDGEKHIEYGCRNKIRDFGITLY